MEAAVGRLRGAGHKATPQRVAVLRALAAGRRQSMGEVRARCPGVGVVTVYRSLGLFCELGIARSLNLGNGPCYELAGDHHHHLICDSCGDVSEFVECPLDLERLSFGGSGFEVRSHSVEIYGRCAACGGPGR